jgi:hypothetical protein
MEDEGKCGWEQWGLETCYCMGQYISTSISSTKNLHGSKKKKQISYFIEVS